MTGSEPDFNPDLYNKNKGLKEALNCFAYGFDYKHLPKKSYCTKDSCPLPFPQPGRASGYPKWSKVNGKRCPDLTARLFGDVPDLKTATFEKRCPKKYSKIALVVDEDEDFTTLAGYLLSRFGQLPARGDHCEFDAPHARFKFEVLRIDGRRIAQVRITKLTASSEVSTD
jgi:hypothetical protein